MDKKEIVKRLCNLCSEVGSGVFESQLAHDCFCGENDLSSASKHFSFNPAIIEFIEEKVREHIPND